MKYISHLCSAVPVPTYPVPATTMPSSSAAFISIERLSVHRSRSKQLQVRKVIQNVCGEFGSLAHGANDPEWLEALDEGIRVGACLNRIVEHSDVERFNPSPISALEPHMLIVVEDGKTMLRGRHSGEGAMIGVSLAAM